MAPPLVFNMIERRSPTPHEAFEAGRLDCYDNGEPWGGFSDVYESVCLMCGEPDADFYRLRATGPGDEKRKDLPILVLVVYCSCGFHAFDANPQPKREQGTE